MIIANSIIWGAVLIGASFALKGTEQKERVQRIIGGGAAGSLMVMGGLAAKRPE
jgi:hypothetical protein